jgi:hypothetical protein
MSERQHGGWNDDVDRWVYFDPTTGEVIAMRYKSREVTGDE